MLHCHSPVACHGVPQPLPTAKARLHTTAQADCTGPCRMFQRPAPGHPQAPWMNWPTCSPLGGICWRKTPVGGSLKSLERVSYFQYQYYHFVHDHLAIFFLRFLPINTFVLSIKKNFIKIVKIAEWKRGGKLELPLRLESTKEQLRTWNRQS